MADMVTLTLAHPLDAAAAERVMAEKVKDYKVGEKITVRADYALNVIRAGYAAGVDPGDPEAVKAALKADPATVTHPAAVADDGKKTGKK